MNQKQLGIENEIVHKNSILPGAVIRNNVVIGDGTLVKIEGVQNEVKDKKGETFIGKLFLNLSVAIIVLVVTVLISKIFPGI